ncbi:hypothetical protein MNR01_00290 [Lysobacter sp. S4-A87]|uniref:hypothetical protein n=1 Tax=Lysobacter sp. S4-A87 TaxID=2925843 RepID=UPI001F5311BC|nr:hypothetical protein [Lysobacter sp. S4-A87]UNK49523.1 hypothetical protein MNR01_00290 [Lysobacter sp. S4-A87]
MHLIGRRLAWIAGLAFATATVAASIAMANGDSAPRRGALTSADQLLLAPDGKVGDETFGQLTARWWQWAEYVPVAPFLDPDGRYCEIGQEGPVWFLAGTNGKFNAHRECVVPAGRYLLVPIINMRHSSFDEDLPLPCVVLQGAAAVNNERLGSAVALIDGVRVTDVTHYRVRSDGCFPLQPGNDKTGLTAADGYWLLIKPLPTGRHTLTIGANYASDDEGYGKMVQNFEYVLHVGGRADLAVRGGAAPGRDEMPAGAP